MTLRVLPISAIEVDENRQRKFFPEEAMAELRDSILTNKGLMCPILVRQDPETETYHLIAGERRLRTILAMDQEYTFGSETIAKGHIPAIISRLSDEMDQVEAELHENTVRLDLTWQEKVSAINRLHELKLKQNPKQKIGETAILIDTTDQPEKTGYASSGAYARVQNAVFLARHLENPEVGKATTIKEAIRVASRVEEEEQMKKLRELAAQKAAAPTPPKPIDASRGTQNTEMVDAFLAGITSKLTKENWEFHEGDCLESMKKLKTGSINVVITDPPYGVGVADFGDSGSATTLAHEYSEEHYIDLHTEVIQELDRLCAPNAHVYMFCDPFIIEDEMEDGEPTGISYQWWNELRQLFPERWRVRRTPLIWFKGHTGNLADGTAQGYKRSHEYILYATTGTRPGSFISPDVLTYPMVKSKIHAAQKPVPLIQELLKMSAVPGDTILDPFAGSGTIYHAAANMMLNVIGMEQHPKFAQYCRMALEGKSPDKPVEF